MPAFARYTINEGPEFEGQAHGEVVSIRTKDGGFGVGLRDIETGKVTLIDGVEQLQVNRPYEHIESFSGRLYSIPLGYVELELSIRQSKIVHYTGDGYVDATAEEVPDDLVSIEEPKPEQIGSGQKLLPEGDDE